MRAVRTAVWARGLPVSGVAGLALALLSLGSSAEADGTQASASAAANADPTAVASKAADSSSSPIRGDSASAAKALLAIVDADPLALARVAQRFGDLAIVALLEPATDTMVRLAAVRTSPWLRAPERALARLAEIASGRDSELAPAAARAAQQISQQLDAEVLARRECLASELTAALIALRALGEREHTAPHVRAYAWAAAAQLVAAGVPLPAVK